MDLSFPIAVIGKVALSIHYLTFRPCAPPVFLYCTLGLFCIGHIMGGCLLIVLFWFEI